MIHCALWQAKELRAAIRGGGKPCSQAGQQHLGAWQMGFP